MGAERELTTEEAGQRYFLARSRFLSSPSTDEDALREYEDAADVLLSTFVDSMDDIAQAAKACESYRRALIRSATKKVERQHYQVLGRT
jgi:hypothetical protein